jgi:hypothetical protein
MLLRAVVQIALDPAPVPIRGEDEPGAGSAKLRELRPQAVEGRPRTLRVLELQADRPPR